jgi:hypothetical protein
MDIDLQMCLNDSNREQIPDQDTPLSLFLLLQFSIVFIDHSRSLKVERMVVNLSAFPSKGLGLFGGLGA